MRRLIVVLLVVVFGIQSLAIAPTQAAMISTADIVAGDSSLASDRDRLNALIQREDVREEFRRQGVDPDEAAARVAALTDAEVADITARIDELPAGQNAIAVIVGAAVLVFLVLLLTDLLCLTSVFDFTRCAR